MKISSLISDWTERLTPRYGNREAAAIVREALMFYLNTDRVGLAMKGSESVETLTLNRIEKGLSRIDAGEPVQYVTGEAWFHGLRLKVTPDVLIPRPETSQLVDMIEDDFKGEKDLRVLDLCTGSGAIALALSRDLPFSSVTGVDISKEALSVAVYNGKNLNVSVEFVEGDVLNPETLPAEKWDIIVSNPPYIPENEIGEIERNVLEYEPRNALIVKGDDPILFYRSIARWAVSHLNDHGSLYFEINPHFAESLRNMLTDTGFGNVELYKDFDGLTRFIRARM